MSSGCTIQNIYPEDSPNVGKSKINDNFACLATGSVTGFSGSFFSNSEPSTIQVGGIQAGTTFENNFDMQQMFNLLLYPFQTPTFSSFSINSQPQTVEVGTSLSGLKTFSWQTTNSSNVETDSITITDTTNATTLGSSLANDGSEQLDLIATIQKTQPINHVWTISGDDTQNNPFSQTYTIQWMWKVYFGTSNNTTLNQSQILDLAEHVLTTSTPGTYSYTTGGYKYLCVPDSFPQINTVSDQLTGFNIPLADSSDGYNSSENGFFYQTVSITNGLSQTTDYRVYRTKNILGSSINIIIT